ncbi:hypothetical protein [Paenochrobactrum pullorum]|uniref:hypothetical protein n=1 Tax=Paenochrobactrum pullorum TaxID=1324351 RepID=UPI0035BC95C6
MQNDVNSEPSSHAQRAYDIHYRFHATMLNAAIDSGKEAIKAAILLNGGACIALLSFLAVISTRENSLSSLALVQPTKDSLGCFALGLLLAAIGSCMAFLSFTSGANSQAHYDLRDEYPFIFQNRKTVWLDRLSLLTTVLAITSILSSYSLFAYAVFTIGMRI